MSELASVILKVKTVRPAPDVELIPLTLSSLNFDS